jgi:hypothetical protein
VSHTAARNIVHQLAVETGRLRRTIPAGSSACHTVDRISNHILSLSLILHPTAGELAGWNAPGDDLAVVEALRVVDDQDRVLRLTLGMSAS